MSSMPKRSNRMERRFDVIVVGGGVVGLACAYALLGKGRSVCVLEGDDLGNGASPTGTAGC
jgi:glycine/D-amino acid oxidase-like deaminating enzyme